MALLIGASLMLGAFPHWALIGALPPGAPPRGDFAQHVLGQRYFFAQPWGSEGWAKLLIDRRLDAPRGANIAMTDSIPLLSLLAKLFRPWLPGFDQVETLYQAMTWVLQPAAAMFALRSAGERRWVPGLAIAVMAASMPTFLFRLWHAALSGHFFLLIMLGLHLRIVRGSRTALLCACALQVLLLLVHPYLMVMASVLLLAAPLTCFLRRERRWRPMLLASAASSGVMLLLGQVLGYWGAGGGGGFGYYSMNLLAPFWPTFSAVIPGIPFAWIDGTGGQAEGYQYLGLGLLGLIAVSAFGWRLWWAALRRHPGLALACCAMLALSVTNWVFLGRTRIIYIPFPSRLLSQIRGSGRLFWIVAYALLTMSTVVVARRFRRAGSVILVCAALLQFVDAGRLRQTDRLDLATPAAYPFDQQRLSRILRAHTQLTVLPTFPCNGGGTEINMDLLWLAGRTTMATNTMYVAREAQTQKCLPAQVLHSRPASDEIRVVLPGFRQIAAAMPDQSDDCRILEPYILCSRHGELLAGLPAYVVTPTPMSTTLAVRSGAPGANLLMAGWTAPVGNTPGVFSNTPSAFLGAAVTPPPSGAIRLAVRASAVPSARWFGHPALQRAVSVWADGQHIADWSIGPAFGNYEAVIPADRLEPGGVFVVELRTTALTSRLDLGRGTDPRRFGILLLSARLAPEKEQGAALNPLKAEP